MRKYACECFPQRPEARVPALRLLAQEGVQATKADANLVRPVVAARPARTWCQGGRRLDVKCWHLSCECTIPRVISSHDELRSLVL
ncbi:hypothetical protein NDU88_000245 [Pleurodeles waltl]|uniref:Uncharacterized protein n=1 Tax=Pleurodeles waltl TaxID=8319 RepID=A0AAV7NFI7_PLEWA|nr:hypothetical protein NDU88_000245 [Pleurodeles waltl]